MSKTAYPEVNPNPDFARIEESVLAFWRENGTFQRSIDNRKDAKEFIFYDGPPFANGLPHYGHLLTGFVKDVFARYETMKGKRVERRFGWDCHGLPAEMGSEKELGISGRQAIQNYGIGKFNDHCRTSVMKYTHEWETYVTRQARWVDFKGDYKTMDTNFMESVLWAFKQIYDKGWVYEAYRVMPYSWAAETPLSNFETKLDNSYREREDKAVTVAFELKEKPKGAPDADKYYVLAWTTTPWTLPSNLALAVNTEMEYALVTPHVLRGPGTTSVCYVVAKSALSRYAKEFELAEDQTPQHVRGDKLLGLTYTPLFPYFQNHPNAFRVLDGSNFVTDGDGTGIVHMAPGFGEEDQKCCEANGIEVVVPVDGQGKYTDAIYDLPDLQLKGLNVIAENVAQFKFGEANERIIRWLKDHGQLIKQEQIKHNYPHCWRTDQPLIYRAMPSWYVEVTKFRDRAAELNQQINWIPAHIRDGQMGHMLATAPDWSISRNRFWGTPIPVWKGDKGGIKVFGSIAELEAFFYNVIPSAAEGSKIPPQGRDDTLKITDLHRPFIDTLVKTDEHGETWKRVEDVFDCWFESGSMPFAQVHYPFENKEWFDNHFPADFITEYVGQTRGWFNTLIMLSTALFDKPPFLNCICHGVVLDAETGLKYSKRLKNYKDPLEVINVFGADALRWMMIASPVMRGQDLMVDPEGKFIRDVVRLAIKPIWNAYNFFTLYANADGIKAKISTDSKDVMDRYILAKCKLAVETIEKSLDAYDTPSACEAVSQFFDALNNWYIRRNKERFWSNDKNSPDKQAAYDTLYTVLTTMCRAAAPLLPLTLEDIYKGLTGEASVHLAEFPSLRAEGEAIQTGSPRGQEAARDDELMDRVRDVCNAALSIRNKLNIRVRQPLKELRIEGVHASTVIAFGEQIIKDEVNVKNVVSHNTDFAEFATFKLSLNNPILGKRLPEKMKQIIPAAKKGEWKERSHNSVEVCGEVLRPDEFSIQFEPKPEYKDRAQALSTNDALVILDTTITPELEAEGIARDLVRMIQQARKDADLNVSDRIDLHVDAQANIAQALKEHAVYVMEQTLSKLSDTKPEKPAFSTENVLDDQKVVISFSVAA